jgi:hypothetical protein
MVDLKGFLDRNISLLIIVCTLIVLIGVVHDVQICYDAKLNCTEYCTVKFTGDKGKWGELGENFTNLNPSQPFQHPLSIDPLH